MLVSKFSAARPIETYHGNIITLQDALLVLEAARLNLLPQVKRRFNEEERKLITSGSVYAWNESECGMKRWTDGKSWLASKVKGPFLTYQEHDEKRKIKPKGMVKQSFSLTTKQNEKFHLIAYYNPQDRIRGMDGKLPSKDIFFAKLYFDPAVYLHDILPMPTEYNAVMHVKHLAQTQTGHQRIQQPMERIERPANERIRIPDMSYAHPYYHPPPTMQYQYMPYPRQQVFMPVPYENHGGIYRGPGHAEINPYQRLQPQGVYLERYNPLPNIQGHVTSVHQRVPNSLDQVPNTVSSQIHTPNVPGNNIQNGPGNHPATHTIHSGNGFSESDRTLPELRRLSGSLALTTLPVFTYSRAESLLVLRSPGWVPRQSLPSMEHERNKEAATMKRQLPSANELLLATKVGKEHEKAFSV